MIFNPAAARGRGGALGARARRAFGVRAEFWPTERPGHAEELAARAAAAGFDVVAAAGGDGTVHEVANGLLRAKRPGARLGILPAGSANDYAYTLRAEGAAPGDVRTVDVGWVGGPDGRERYFVNGLGLGFNGAVTMEARRIRRLRGLPLYGLALLKALYRSFRQPAMTICLDEVCGRTATLALTLALGKREGNFVVAPAALVGDGWFDFLHVGPVSRREVLRFMPRLATGRPLPADHGGIRQGRCRSASVESDEPLVVHVDGEFFCVPEEGVRRLEARLLPGALQVELLPTPGARSGGPPR